ncbi:MAG: hypothetical protein FWG77_12580, partial [Treponema sp.]|nr:hypothetical protein [Treponema sp.]
IEDLMSALSRRDTYPIRANTAQGAERLGFTEPSRIRVSGGVGLPLLDLLIGSGDALGREVYLKLSDRNEIHSGEDRFTMFTEARANFWLDFRLFTPASIADVQQVEVNISDSESYALRRSGNGWVIIGNETITLDGPAVDAWVRNLLEAEGENFATDPPEAAEIGIILRFGDGRTGTLYIGPADENNRRQAITSDSQFYFILSEWTVARLIRESSSFYR